MDATGRTESNGGKSVVRLKHLLLPSQNDTIRNGGLSRQNRP